MPTPASVPAAGLGYEVRDRVAWLTLDRPHKLNAIDGPLMAALLDAAAEVTEDPDVWGVVVRGAGGRAFSVGMDLGDVGDSGAQRRPVTPMVGSARTSLFEAFLEIPKPVVAVVDGYCLAAGLELALACDLRICSDASTFAMPEARVGMGGTFASVVLPRLIPRGAALEMLYLGEHVPADRAHQLGLVNRVVPADELAGAADALVARLMSSAPISLRRYKEMTTKGWELPVPAALRLNAGPNPYTSADRVEGVRAFNERRAPEWRNE